MIGKVSSPGLVACSPSAIVRGTGIEVRSPAASERLTSSPASGSTPMILSPGANALAAVAQPEIRPPPDTGTTSASRGPASSSSSSPTVPCPAITRGSSNGWIGWSPRLVTRFRKMASRSSP